MTKPMINSQGWFQKKLAAHAPAVKDITKLRIPLMNQVAQV